MRQRRLILLLGLAGLAGCVRSAAEERRSAADALPAGRPAATWELSLGPDATPTVSYQNAPVVTAGYVAWGANWQWTGSDLRAGPARDGVMPLEGRVEGLGLSIAGEIEDAGGRAVYHYRIEAAQALAGVIGLCLEWRLGVDTPGFGQPELLPGNTGWRWPAGEQEVRLEFDPAVANVYFEPGQQGVIRTYLVAGDVPAGGHEFAMTLSLPAGAATVDSPAARYGNTGPEQWPPLDLLAEGIPVDLSELNEKPAGARGFVRAEGDRLVFADGTPARFWGGNLAAYSLFVPNEQIDYHARRIAGLGYNLMRLHHHDSTRWVEPTVLDKTGATSQQLNAAALERIDYWIKALRDQGVYVWLDLHVGREFKAGDGIPGWDEIAAHGAEGKGYCYYNERIEALMREFQAAYLGHVNAYTGLAYRDDPAIMGVLITNENDLTNHFGNLMLGDKGNPHHNALFEADVTAFCQATGLPREQTWRTWEAGPAKIYLNQREAAWNQRMLSHLLELGVKVPIATTNFWGNGGLWTLPALTTGGIIDAHSYGGAEALSANPRREANFIAWIGAAQVAGMPLSVTEWNTPYPTVDRAGSPLYVAAVGALQGWDAPMIYNYAQGGLGRPERAEEWSTWPDPALTGVMPAAALAFRRGDIAPARGGYHLQLSREQCYFGGLTPANSAALRTAVEQRRLTIGLPDIPELEWDRATPAPDGATVITDPDQDLLPPGATAVVSDTGEIARDWAAGIQIIDTPRTQAFSGWIGGQTLESSALRVALRTPKAVVVASSLDGLPLTESRDVLLTAIGRVVAPGGRLPFRAEPIVGTVALRRGAGWQELELTAEAPRHWVRIRAE